MEALSGWQLVAAQLLASATLASGLMTAVWLIQRQSKNAGIVDVAWGAGIGMVAVLLAATSPGNGGRRLLAGCLIGLWSLRLTIYLLRRVVGHPEEGRYATLRSRWGAAADHRLFWFFQMQAATVILFALPVWLAAFDPQPLWRVVDQIGIAIWAAGAGGSALADWQLARFKSDPNHRGQTCRVGLWRYSRHPNYFFEWVHWWSYTLLAHGGPYWWLAPLTPLVLLYFLLYVTGIPPTEAQALASRGNDYRDYQRTTSPFVPWFPMRDPR